MAVMDMIMEAMSPTPDKNFLQKAERLDRIKDKHFAKSFNIGGNRDQAKKIPVVTMQAKDALKAIESHIQTAADLNLSETAPDLADILKQTNALESFCAPKAPSQQHVYGKALESFDSALQQLEDEWA